MSKKAICQICEDEINMKGMWSHLHFKHEVEFEDYLKQHVESVPGYKRCEICGEPTDAKGNKKFTTCSRECLGKYREKYLSGENATFYGKSHSEETKEMIAEKAKERLSDPENHWNYGNEWSDDIKQKIAKTQRENAQKEDYENPMTGETHSEEAIKKILENSKDSSLEKKAIDIFEENDIEYVHQFFLRAEDGDLKSYDFYLPEKGVIVEMDGDFWHGGPGCEKHHEDIELTKANDRLKDKLAEKEGYDIVRIWESEFEQDKSVVLEKCNGCS